MLKSNAFKSCLRAATVLVALAFLSLYVWRAKAQADRATVMSSTKRSGPIFGGTKSAPLQIGTPPTRDYPVDEPLLTITEYSLVGMPRLPSGGRLGDFSFGESIVGANGELAQGPPITVAMASSKSTVAAPVVHNTLNELLARLIGPAPAKPLVPPKRPITLRPEELPVAEPQGRIRVNSAPR